MCPYWLHPTLNIFGKTSLHIRSFQGFTTLGELEPKSTKYPETPLNSTWGGVSFGSHGDVPSGAKIRHTLLWVILRLFMITPAIE